MASVKRASSRPSRPRSNTTGTKVTFNGVPETKGQPARPERQRNKKKETTDSGSAIPTAPPADVCSTTAPEEVTLPVNTVTVPSPSAEEAPSPERSEDVLMETTNSSNDEQELISGSSAQAVDTSQPFSDPTAIPPINTTPLPSTESAIGQVCPICTVVNCPYILNKIRAEEGIAYVSPQISKLRSSATKTGRIAGPVKSRMKAGRTNRVSAQLLKQSVQRSKVAETQRKLRREDVPHRNFMLNNLSWSPWKPFLAPSNTNIPKGWRARGNGKMGMLNTKVFDKTEDGPAVYEMAVQPAPKSKCYPVHFMATKGTTSNPQSRVLRHPRAKAEVERVLQRGCKVFMRRARLSDSEKVKVGTQSVDSVKELRNLVKQVYDYPWSNPTTKPGRKVLKHGRIIASGPTNL